MKKSVANVNFGLLEKGQNKVQKSKIFDTLEEVRYHQATYGGKVSIQKKLQEEVVEQQYDLYFGLDIEPNTNSKWIEDEQKYYILNVSDCATLKNGFRYIKELLLQHHNFQMYRDYQTLTANGIDVFSVKTDAFTIKNKTLKLLYHVFVFTMILEVGDVQKQKTLNCQVILINIR